MNPPTEYLAYMDSPDSITEGEREGTMSGSFILWPPAEIEQSNREYEVGTYAPGFLAFGSNGGGELFAFDAAGAVFLLPAIGMSPDDAIRVSGSWAEFVSQITPDA